MTTQNIYTIAKTKGRRRSKNVFFSLRERGGCLLRGSAAGCCWCCGANGGGRRSKSRFDVVAVAKKINCERLECFMHSFSACSFRPDF